MTPPPKTGTAQRMAQQCIAVRVRLINRAVTQIYEDALRHLGVTTSQMNILIFVAFRTQASPSEVGRMLSMEKSSVSRTTERMREHGWLKVTDNPDGRGKRLQATKTGLALLERAKPGWDAAQREAKALLGEMGLQSVFETADELWKQAADAGGETDGQDADACKNTMKKGTPS